MKITDNMLRVINHAYTTLTPTAFLIKTNIIQLEDEDIIIKSLEVAAMISKIIQYIETNAEKRFYAYQLPVEAYNKAIILERSTLKDVVTIKEFIIGNGLVYSEFLDYVYDSLAKYEFTTKSKEVLSTSLDKTHTKLQYILQLKGGVVPGSVDVEAIQKELNRLDSIAMQYQYGAEYNLGMLEDGNKSIENTINSLENTLSDVSKHIDNIPILDNYANNYNSKELMEELDNKIKAKLQWNLEEQANAIANSILNKIDTIKIDSIECKIVDNIGYNVQDLLDKLSKNIINKVEQLTTPNADNNNNNDEVVKDIEAKVTYLLSNVNGISQNNTLEKVSKQLDNLYLHLEDMGVDNRAYGDLIESSIDGINSRFK